MLDIRRTGTSSRTSPEDPSCLVLTNLETKKELGGAANLARWLAAGEGTAVDLYTLYVRDRAGFDLEALCREANIRLNRSLAKLTEAYCTTVKERICLQERPGGRLRQLARCDVERLAPLTDYDYGHLMTDLTLGDYDVVVVADYDKGMFSGQHGQALQQGVAQLNGPMTVINTKRPDRWAKYRVDYLVCNSKEALQIPAGATDNYSGVEADTRIVTRSEKGVSCYWAASEWHFPSQARVVLDCTGAGDAFTAGFVLEMLRATNESRPYRLEEALQFGQEWAAHCCSLVGCGTPPRSRRRRDYNVPMVAA